MSTAPQRPRKALSGYFWLMHVLFALLAIGVFLLVAGVAAGRLPYLFTVCTA